MFEDERIIEFLNMTTKLSGFTKFRLGLVFLFSVLTLQLSAQPAPGGPTGPGAPDGPAGPGAKMEIVSDETLVCGGGGIYLSVKNAKPNHFLLYQEKHDDGPWIDASNSVTKEVNLGTSMPVDVDFVYYRVTDETTREVSNVVAVERDKSAECSKICHTTTTGEQFTGTDFDPIDEHTEPRIPDQVVSHFNDYNITFRKGGVGDNYKITNDLESFFGTTPSLDNAADVNGKNYYYTVEDVNKTICVLSYDAHSPQVIGKPYQFRMRLYVQYKPECGQKNPANDWDNAQFIARTEFGRQSTDYLVASAYDDATGRCLTPGDSVLTANSSDNARIYLRDLMNLNEVPTDGGIVRMEITYYGWFPEDRNGLDEFAFAPEFAQFDCSRVAVDYISADIASVCMSGNPVCVNELGNIKAIGFPFQAEYVWEYYDGANWLPVMVNGQPHRGMGKTYLDVLPTSVGKTLYRVYDAKTVDKTNDYLTFNFISKACNPDCPSDFLGPAKVCIPNDTVIVFQPYPFTKNPDYAYEWQLTDMEGNPVGTSENLYLENPDSTFRVSFKADKTLPEGKYKISCKLFKVAEGLHVEVCDTANEISVFHRPSALFDVIKGGESQTICPFSEDVQFGANQVDDRYTYTWTNANALADEPYKAVVDVPHNHCELSKFDAQLIVAITDFTACADTQFISMVLDKTQPEVDCDALGGDKEFFADSISVVYKDTLPLPVVKATCDANPTIEIRIDGTKANKEPFHFELIKKLSELATVESRIVELPITAGKAEYSNGSNGYRVTYVAKDGCAQPSDTCSYKVIVRDTFPARVNCDLIPNYTDHLKNYPYDQCVATPGTGNPLELPVLTVPVLEDTLHPGTFITAIMESRSDGATDLNAPFNIGVTTITWLFLDDALNASYCFQKITVIDDKMPEVKCPDQNKFRVHPDKGECTVSAESLIAQIKEQLGETNLPVAVDRCENNDTLQPTFYWKKESDTEWFPLETASKFELKINYQLQWRFYKKAGESVDETVFANCQEDFKVIDDKTPEFDCSSIPDVVTDTAPKGLCELPSNHILRLFDPWPYAIEVCTKDSIKGEISLPDGSPLPEKIAVGDTIDVLWTFKDLELTDSVKYCHKKLHVVAQSLPIFDCSSLGLLVDTADVDKCEQDLSHLLDLQKWPTAIDSCTGNKIPGVATTLDGSALPEKLKVGDTLTILWTFVDLNYSIGVKTCTQLATVIGQNPVNFDCNSIANDTLKFPTEKGECFANLGEGDLTIPYGTDFCTGTLIPGIPSRQDGGPVYGKYDVGITMLDWRFISPFSIDTSKVCSQPVLVQSDKEMDAHCGKENYPDIQIDVTDGCGVGSADVLSRLTEHFADHPCLDIKIPGVPSRSDGLAMTDSFAIDTIEIIWTFTDKTNTLLTPVTTCRQVVMISNGHIPPVDCDQSFPAATIQMDTANCSIDLVNIPVFFKGPIVNPCNGDTAVYDTTRQSGAGIHDPFVKGEDVIIWKFTFPSTGISHTCYQKVTVIDTMPPYFDCSSLHDIVAEMRDSAYKGFPYAQLVDSGLVIPQATAKCCDDLVTTYTRSDGKLLEEAYPMGGMNKPTTITWTFTSNCNGYSKQCKQNIYVVDLIPPRVVCPHLGHDLSCMLDTPSAWTTYDEFKAAGGSVIPEDRALLNTFDHKDVIVGDECLATMVRTYTLVAINGDVVSCESPDTFNVFDNEPPVFHGINPSGEVHVTSCADADTTLPHVYVTDCDPNPTLVSQRLCNQGSDPSKCDYYTYDVICTWWAADRCGNSAVPVTYTVHVKDTVPPQVDLPADWDDVLHPVYLKNCIFGVPDITNLIPDSAIHQDCGDGYTKKWQEPAPGTVVDETTIIKLYISDVCGNYQVFEKTLIVEPREQIINLTVATDPAVCGDDVTIEGDPRVHSNTLADNNIRKAAGKIWAQDWDGSWFSKKIEVTYDYYRGALDEQHLIYSDNKYTYAHLFESTKKYYQDPVADAAADRAYIKYLMLLRQTQSDVYYFVAMDTISGCTDTAATYIIVNERPRIEVASGPYSICDGESLPVYGEFGEAYPACIDDMGSPVYNQGWLLNGREYVPGTPVTSADGWEQTAVYFASNGCGTTTAKHTLFNHCGEPYLLSALDSLNFIGNSAEKYRLLKKDSLYTSDSVRIKLYTRYEPSQVLLTTTPTDKARIYAGQDVALNLTMPYDAALTKWMRVENEFDGENNAEYNKHGEVISGGSFIFDDVDIEREMFYNDHDTTNGEHSIYVPSSVVRRFVVPGVQDTSFYYAIVGNGVCPAVVTNLVQVDIIKEIPTAITPYTKDGLNDEFMLGHHVIIYNRYGQVIFEGDNGWDGTYRGILADPGVYFYSVDWQGTVQKGSVEVVKIE